MNKTTVVFAGLGFELFACVVGALFIGPVLDEHFGWKGTGFLIMGGLLFIGWVVHFIYLIQKYMKETDEAEKK